jgi:hypothetical protein
VRVATAASIESRVVSAALRVWQSWDQIMQGMSLFCRPSLVDLTIAIGLMNTYNRMAIGFRNTPMAVIPKQVVNARRES